MQTAQITKYQITSTKSQIISNGEIKSSKQYDLEERTFLFAKNCRTFIKALRKTTGNIEDGKQLARSSGSVAANYIEANESLSKKDFAMRIKISRKEAKESRLWLKLSDIYGDPQLNSQQLELMQEANELTKIFNSIAEKSK